mgnify:CR=1 FL=1
MDIAQVLELTDEEQEEIGIFILDTHRPLNLDNVYSDTIRVFDDGEVCVTGVPALPFTRLRPTRFLLVVNPLVHSASCSLCACVC